MFPGLFPVRSLKMANFEHCVNDLFEKSHRASAQARETLACVATKDIAASTGADVAAFCQDTLREKKEDCLSKWLRAAKVLVVCHFWK